MSGGTTEIWRDHDASPLLWLTTGSLALVAHLALLQAGVASYQAGIGRDKPAPPAETRIIATALQLAGARVAPPQVQAVTISPEAVAPLSAQSLARPAASSPTLQATLSAEPAATAEESTTAAVPQELPPAETLTAREVLPAATDTAVTRPALPLDLPGSAPIAPTQQPQEAVPSETLVARDVVTAATNTISTNAKSPVESSSAASITNTVAPQALAPVTAPTVATSPNLESAILLSPVVTPEPDPVPQTAPQTEVATVLPALADATEDQAGVASANAPDQTPEQAQETYTTVVDFLRGFDGGPCFAALPVLAEDGAFRFETFARSRADLIRFRQSLEISTGTLPGTVMKPISDAQCQALPFVTGAARYPEFQLYFDLSARQIPSGEFLSGTLGNTSGGFVSLLLIDDEGVVQDLGSFLKFRPGFAGFDIPMTVKGEVVETQQLLMALSTRARLRTLAELSGKQADEVFQRLALEIALQGGGEDVALVAFSVR